MGVGLGLAVARGFAEAIRGTVHSEGPTGGGLTMVLSVPMTPERLDQRRFRPRPGPEGFGPGAAR